MSFANAKRATKMHVEGKCVCFENAVDIRLFSVWMMVIHVLCIFYVLTLRLIEDFGARAKYILDLGHPTLFFFLFKFLNYMYRM